MHTALLISTALNDVAAKILREELEGPLDWSRLYPLSWLYALARSIHLQEENLYNSLKNLVFSLLDDKKKFMIAIYDHEGAAGILFSLYHIASKEKGLDSVFNNVLEIVEKLRWHEFDGEIMAFSYMLASKVNAKEHISKLNMYIDEHLKHWFSHLDYDSQRNISYVLFGYAYILDNKLVDIVKNHKLYSIDSELLRKIMNSYDVELIALILYMFGRIAYSKKLRRAIEKKVGKNAIRDIRYRIIPSIGNVLARRISEAGILVDTKSVPSDLLAKIQLARIESGLDKPFMLSKYEWRIYQEILKTFKHGYYRVLRQHLTICLVLDALLLLPSFFIVIAPILPDMLGIVSGLLKHPYYKLMRLASLIILNILYGINVSLYQHGSIKKEYLSGVVKYIVDLVMKMVRKK